MREPRRTAIGVLAAGALAPVAALSACGAPPTPLGGIAAEITGLAIVERGEGASWIEADGVVRGVAEDGGVCRFTFWAENGAASRLTTSGRVDGGATRCGPVSEQIGRTVIPGRYEVELRYDSTSASTRSARLAFEIPGAEGE